MFRALVATAIPWLYVWMVLIDWACASPQIPTKYIAFQQILHFEDVEDDYSLVAPAALLQIHAHIREE